MLRNFVQKLCPYNCKKGFKKKNKDPACGISLEIYSGMLRIKFLFDPKFSG